MVSEETVTKEKVIQEEELIKELVYRYFRGEIERTREAASQAKLALDSGAYESQFSSIYASALAKKRKELITVSSEINSLYKNPYFSHIKVALPEDDDTIHFLLSDCPDLDNARTVNRGRGDSEIVIVPFRQDEHLRLLSALFSVYQAKTGEPFSSVGPDGTETKYTPELIRDVTIASGIIEDVRQYFPEVFFEEETIDFDEILAQRLDENRNSAMLRNIIATLQREQYSIVQTPQDQSFVVQGCAGSGKSQCLIHRLFFLRSAIGGKGWEKVLLITPSQLFRNYSKELMNRFRLSSVTNTSIAELYRALLFRMDDRFKNRQYRFELSEEYLPDEYLHQVYSDAVIRRIRTEITSAIRNYVTEACAHLNIPAPKGPVSFEEINALVERLDSELKVITQREAERSRDESYLKMMAESEKQEKAIVSAQRTQERLASRRAGLLNKLAQLSKLHDDLDQAESELASWLTNLDKQQAALRAEVDEALAPLSSKKLGITSLGALNQYLSRVARFLDATCAWGEKYKFNSEHEEYLRGYIALCQDEIKAFTKGKSIRALENSLRKELNETEERIQSITATIAEAEQALETVILQLQEYTNDETIRSRTKARIEAMEASRYFLSRIESSVFEREIWNTLAPLKEQCGIKTLDIEDLENGKHREIRILYKSDLLFYLRIYMDLGQAHNLTPYEYVCVDEGQDLHSFDYETLRDLFPNAVFNVFGDIDQALHVDCGIRDWKKEAGIPKVFELTKNYRNTPAVVSFINREFGAKMEPCGSVRPEQAPKRLHTKVDLATLLARSEPLVVIVKDKESFAAFASIAGRTAEKLNFIDTHTTEEIDGKISCFSVFAAKGLEFPNVLVWPDGMTVNQKVVACSRALKRLYYWEQ